MIYRKLQKHEAIREGDGWTYIGGSQPTWSNGTISTCIGDPVAEHPRYIWYREVRIVSGSPQWRYLDIGEHLQTGAEVVDGHAMARCMIGDLDVFGFNLTVTEPEPTICGCGNHAVDPAGDIYAQHRDWTWKNTHREPADQIAGILAVDGLRQYPMPGPIAAEEWPDQDHWLADCREPTKTDQERAAESIADFLAAFR